MHTKDTHIQNTKRTMRCRQTRHQQRRRHRRRPVVVANRCRRRRRCRRTAAAARCRLEKLICVGLYIAICLEIIANKYIERVFDLTSVCRYARRRRIHCVHARR